MNADVSKEKDDYKVSRIACIFEALFEYFIAILTSGAYLAKLTSTIGISDAMTAILSSITSFAGMFQIISIFIAHRTPVKRWILPTVLLMQALASTLYTIPFLKIGAFAPILFFIIILTTSAAANVVSPAKSNWIYSLVEQKMRGSFQSKISTVSIAGGMIFTFIASRTIDKYEASGDMSGLFTIITIVIFILAILQFSCLLIARERPATYKKASSPFDSIGSLCKNKLFIKVMILNAMWAVATNLTTPFLATYQIKELGFSMTFISTVGIGISIVQMFVVSFFGKYSTSHSYASVAKISYIFALLAFGTLIFTTASNGQIMFTIYRVFNLFFSSASAVCSTCILFAITKPGETTSAMAFNTIITGLVGFSATLVASPILTALQKKEIILFGTQIYAQQILALSSFVMTALLLTYYLIFCHKGIKEA